jgi:signal transduction histidine kinase
MLPIGTRLPLGGDSVAARIFHTGAPARMDTYTDVEGETAVVARGLRLRTTVGAPILVDGQLWGALMAATRGVEPFPEDAETRIAAFTELVATAISNTDAREALAQLADEQAALRRVATLVAQGVRPAQIFSAVSNEVDRLFGSTAAVLRFEQDGAATVVVGVSSSIDVAPGTRWELQDGMASVEVYRTGRSSRFDSGDWSSAPGPAAATARRLGISSTVASPIVVDGRLWGAMAVWSARELLPADAEARLEKFTELVATAIANADSKAELAASRRRIVAASDEARRRIERDLHDGTQQRLVSLGLGVRAAEADLPPDADARAALSRVATALNDAVTELQEITRGIHPAILSQGGLGPALRTVARRSAIPVELEIATDTRLPAAIEVAAYYVACEALANAAKHAQASRVELSVARRDGKLLLSIRDDGVGGADPADGSGLVGLTDRVEALGGSMDVQSRPGEGTHIVAELPLEVDVTAES